MATDDQLARPREWVETYYSYRKWRIRVSWRSAPLENAYVDKAAAVKYGNMVAHLKVHQESNDAVEHRVLAKDGSIESVWSKLHSF